MLAFVIKDACVSKHLLVPGNTRVYSIHPSVGCRPASGRPRNRASRAERASQALLGRLASVRTRPFVKFCVLVVVFHRVWAFITLHESYENDYFILRMFLLSFFFHNPDDSVLTAGLCSGHFAAFFSHVW